jgi:hypothetical protein
MSSSVRTDPRGYASFAYFSGRYIYIMSFHLRMVELP